MLVFVFFGLNFLRKLKNKYHYEYQIQKYAILGFVLIEVLTLTLQQIDDLALNVNASSKYSKQF